MSDSSKHQESDSQPVFWALVLATVGMGVYLLFTSYMGTGTFDPNLTNTERRQQRLAHRAAVEQAAQELKNGAGWVDEEAGTARIPLQEAIALEIAALRTKPVQAAGPVVPPVAPTSPAAEAPSAEASANTAEVKTDQPAAN